jgi:hypothetical protein
MPPNSLSLSGLVKTAAPTEEQAKALAARATGLDTYAATSTTDGWTSSGGLLKENQYAMKSLMVTDPVRYASMRMDGLEPVKEAVNKAKATTMRDYIDAGYTLEEAEKYGKQAADSALDLGMRPFEAKFPTSNDNKLLEVQHNKTKSKKVKG